MVEVKDGTDYKDVIEENVKLKAILEESYDKYSNMKKYLTMLYDDCDSNKNNTVDIEGISKKYEDKIKVLKENQKKQNILLEEKKEKLIIQIDLLKKANEVLANENLAYSEKIKTLESIKNKLEELKNVEIENISLKNKLTNSYETLQSVSNEVKALKEVSDKITTENKVLKKETLDYKKKVLVINKELDETKDKNFELITKNKELRNRLEALRNSKLGKVNRAYWNWRNSFRRKTETSKGDLK